MDKRDLTDQFRDRLGQLLAADGANLAQFAREVGIDRSALSQFLDPDQARLPRAETLHRIAEAKKVSLDWLLGLSQSSETLTELAQSVEIEQAEDEQGRTPLERWYREASGYKIRYVPTSLPDLLLHESMPLFAHRGEEREDRPPHSRHQLDLLRQTQTDIECCMPFQVLRNFASGTDVWSDFPLEIRRTQLAYVRDLLAELYPNVRLFLFDERSAYSAPYTVYGPLRAAVYLGGSYLVINSVDQIHAIIRHFDNLIRHAQIGPDRCGDFINDLLK